MRAPGRSLEPAGVWDGCEGFSLIEMLCVLAIVSIAMAILTPGLNHKPGKLELDNYGRRAEAVLSAAHAQALSSGAEVTVLVDAAQRKITDHRGETLRLPDVMEIRTSSALVRSDAITKGAYSFFPDGTASGGNLQMMIEGKRLQIDIDWLTGRVTSKWLSE